MAEFENINSPSDSTSLEKEIQLAVAHAIEPLLESGAWRVYTGPQQERLVHQLRDLLGATHVGLACSGSAALQTLLSACRLDPGDEVMLSAYDYPGNFTAIENVGARPVLVDLAPNSWNLSLDALAASWTPDCKALIVSHLHGQLQDLAGLQQWCRQQDVILIQDACQALGAEPGGLPLNAWADATIVSFGGSKVISAGRGGAWCTSNDLLAQRARLAAGVGSGAYELSELQAAMVLAQLPYLGRITAQCRSYFQGLAALLSDLGSSVPWLDQCTQTAFYQAGWLSSTPQAQALVQLQRQQTQTQSLAFGRGFDGFHRRSSRRCRKVGQLENAAVAAARTFTIHHRAALELT